MPAASDLIYKLLPPSIKPAAANNYAIPHTNIADLRTALRSDISGALGKAACSLGEAVGAIDRGSFSWACIKLYYAAFYTAKARLFMADEVHVYIDRKPHYAAASSGWKLAKGKGTSHEFVFDRLIDRFSAEAILSEEIEAESPFSWLRSQREEVQYSRASFSEPMPPRSLATFFDGDRRLLLNQYLAADLTDPGDHHFIQLFDPDHAMIAFPLRFFSDAMGHLRTNRFASLPQDLRSFASSTFVVGRQRVAVFDRLLQPH